MKKAVLFLLLFAFILSTIPASAGSVRGYYRKDGTYVRPHYRTNPDGNIWNNYSTKGNINPWTGKKGYVDPYDNLFKPSRKSPYGRSKGLFDY